VSRNSNLVPASDQLILCYCPSLNHPVYDKKYKKYLQWQTDVNNILVSRKMQYIISILTFLNPCKYAKHKSSIYGIQC